MAENGRRWVLMCCCAAVGATARAEVDLSPCALRIAEPGGPKRVEIVSGGRALVASPAEGLWSIATDWKDDWPAGWRHAHPDSVRKTGAWTILSGAVRTPDGEWAVRDSYRPEGHLIKCVRRFAWRGARPAAKVTLSVRWQVPQPRAAGVLPGILYYGNPSGSRTRRGLVASFAGKSGQEAFFEEHRYPMPFACLEWRQGSGHCGAALHSVPSPAAWGNVPDQWWSLGLIGREKHTELALLSGPVALCGQRSALKAGQRKSLPYPDAWLNVPPGAVIEKTFYLEAYPVSRRGSGFRRPVRSSLAIFRPCGVADMPRCDDILRAKCRQAMSRWVDRDGAAGFAYRPRKKEIVLGWCGQAAAPGYALPVLARRLGLPDAHEKAQKSLDFLATVPIGPKGFPVRFDIPSKAWHRPDVLSQAQAMDSFARAIRYGRTRPELKTARWETFLRKACDVHAARIGQADWRPASTNEGFFISPLCRAAKLFGTGAYRTAALKASDHYGERHLSMDEPYWGGTLDASCEDKEGAWAALQGFLAAHELTGDRKYLEWAGHACDVVLSYVVVWDIPMPPGRLSDHRFRSRGWTSVSVQNQHLDVYGVLCAPAIHRLGELTGRQDLQRLAVLMFRSCGQLIDSQGSQGEQLQQTNYGQQQAVRSVRGLRGGYNERWTVFWITAHFLSAAAQFEEMGVREL